MKYQQRVFKGADSTDRWNTFDIAAGECEGMVR